MAAGAGTPYGRPEDGAGSSRPSPAEARRAFGEVSANVEEVPMAKKSRGGRMTAAKKRATKRPGGKGPVRNRPAGKRIMST